MVKDIPFIFPFFAITSHPKPFTPYDMGKISVKHYLEKRIKPLSSDDLIEVDKNLVGKLLYPVYVQIIYNRKTFQLASFSEVCMTEKGFEHYSKNGKFLKNETWTLLNDLGGRYCTIQQETELIEKAFRYNVEILKSQKPLKEILEFLIIDTKLVFVEIAWLFTSAELCDPENKKSYEFLTTFNQGAPLTESLKLFKKYTRIDIVRKFILNDYSLAINYTMWESVDCLLKLYSNTKFIEVLTSDYEKKIERHLLKNSYLHNSLVLPKIKEIIDFYLTERLLI